LQKIEILYLIQTKCKTEQSERKCLQSRARPQSRAQSKARAQSPFAKRVLMRVNPSPNIQRTMCVIDQGVM
jgi:hypothetical protein